ncbi:MAG: hypothetical protein KDA73_09490 [Rhodobacteraceae bacterium]|nr:hypothetical protein [Paracoccaceae bacterium]
MAGGVGMTAAGAAGPAGSGSGPAGWVAWPYLPAAVLAAFLLILMLYALANRLARPVIWRSAIVGLPLALLGAAGYLGVRHDVPPGDQWRVAQAVVAGGVVALGWIVTFAVQEYRRAEERADRVRDTLLALTEEIFTALDRLDAHDIAGEARDAQKKILSGEGEHPYRPFSISQSPPTIYESVSDSVALLPPGVLEPVVRFYAFYSDLTTIIEDTHRADHALLASKRRKALHEELTRVRAGTLYWAVRGLIAINREVRTKRRQKVPISSRNRDVWKDIKDVERFVEVVPMPAPAASAPATEITPPAGSAPEGPQS